MADASEVGVATRDGGVSATGGDVTNAQVPAAGSTRTAGVVGKSSPTVGDGRATRWRDIDGDLAALTMAEPAAARSDLDGGAEADGSSRRGPAAAAGHFVVVAVDFGTSLSGYAFAFVRDPCRAIHMMRRWDGGDPGVVNQKTPTALLLDPLGRFHSFGYTARDFYHDLDDDEARQWLFFDKFKMALHHSDVNIQRLSYSLLCIISRVSYYVMLYMLTIYIYSYFSSSMPSVL